jgi:membrane protein DedA with SNARE-associated domain
MFMTIESFIDSYGYAAILIGTFLEGETILVLGGFAAHRGYLSLPWVIVAALAGTLFGDQLYFFLGRWHGQKVLAKRPSWKARAARAQNLLERFQKPLILVFRFLYGLRTVTPFVIGMSSVSTVQFVLLNIIGALVWAVLVGVGGYAFGSALEAIIGDVKKYELEVLGAIAIIGILIWAIHFCCRKRDKTLVAGV